MACGLSLPTSLTSYLDMDWVLPLRLLVSRGHYFQRPLGRMCASPSPPETMVGDRGARVAQSGALVWTGCPRSSGTLGAVPATSSTGLWAP